MKVTCKVLTIFLLLFGTASSNEATKDQCYACDLIEKEGDSSLKIIRNLSYEELTRASEQGETPFYWSIFHGANQIRDFLIETLKKEDLISVKKASELYIACANNIRCPLENFDTLTNLKFAVNKQALVATITGTQECSIKKFKKLIDLGASPIERYQKEYNILHLIVDRSRRGRLLFERDCLISAVKLVNLRHPDLKSQKNQDGYTPKQLARYLRDHKQEWGSGIKKTDFDSLIKAL